MQTTSIGAVLSAPQPDPPTTTPSCSPLPSSGKGGQGRKGGGIFWLPRKVMEAKPSSSTSKPGIPKTPPVTNPDLKSFAGRALYSSKAREPRARTAGSDSNSNSTRQPAVQQKAWTSTRNPITSRSHPLQKNNITFTHKQAVIDLFREGQRVSITLASGAEFEGIFASPADLSSCTLRMVQQKKLPGDIINGASKREQPNMSFQKKDITDARVLGGNSGKGDGKSQGGNRSNFRTDSAISNGGPGAGRVLQKWVPDASDAFDGGLDSAPKGGQWDQFAENERLFGLKTDYDENMYTTAIDKNNSQYKQRVAYADRVARDIERSTATTAHVAEERVMDFIGGKDNADEEDKYSGVRRDQPQTSGGAPKYTPPNKRAPTGQATVSGAPVDPAIISSQLKSAPKKDAVPGESKPPAAALTKAPTAGAQDAKPAESNKETTKATDSKAVESKTSDFKAAENKQGDKGSASKPGPTAASVERDVLNSFKNFATQQRMLHEKARSTKAKMDKEVKLTELKKFADSFKLSTPVPNDLIGIIAKDPAKQKQIQDKARQNAEDVHKAKADGTIKKESTTAKDSQTKPAAEPSSGAAPAAAADSKPTSRPAPTQHTSSPSNVAGRHPSGRQSYGPQQHHGQSYRSDRSNATAQQNRQTGNLSQRLRSVEQQRMSQPPTSSYAHMAVPDIRPPPTGPASTMEPSYRRLSGLPANHMAAKLNPNSHEFRPNAFAPSFNPGLSASAHPSAGSSPRSAVNVAEPQTNHVQGQLIRRKTKAVNVQKCLILSHVKTFQPQQGRNFDDNGGLRPSYDTPPTWKQLKEEKDNDKNDANMGLTYKELFERRAFGGQSIPTPTPASAMPHHHQLPFHLQPGAQHMGRGSPHMPPMPMHANQHGHMPQVPFSNGDDHRMVHSNSAQSFASPRIGAAPMAYAPNMNSPQVPYNQQVMPPYMPGTPQMQQLRSFSNNSQYMPQQPGHMGGQMVMQQGAFMPQGMMPAPQMPVYPPGHPQMMHPGGAPPQPIPGANGYPSPGRPSAPMMAAQGSQQGQAIYGMSPNMPYQQPVFAPQQPGQMTNMRGYSNPGPQHFGTSPQQMHQYNPQHRNNGNNYNKGYQPHGHNQHQGPQAGHGIPSGPQGRASDGPEESK